MLQSVIELARKEVSGERALNLVNSIASHHRIQSSPGFRAAACFCEETARSYGLETEVHKFRADGRTKHWGCLIPQEWEATTATLALVQPEAKKLADFSEQKISLIQRSTAAHLDSVELVVLNDGLEKNEYRRVDVKGKLVLTRGSVDRVHELAVEQFGAVGIIFDGMNEVKPVRSRLDLPDARQYTSFWWQPGDKKCFGFVLSPRQGEQLRQLASSGAGLTASVDIKSEFRDGEMEVLSCFIPGKTLEEVVLVSHLCHPEPSANDNASGCASVLEAMRVLATLLARREVRPLERGIRALLLPEMTGSIAYLSTHEERHRDIVCALNVDMAGENQTLCGSTLLLESPPDACRGFSRDLATLILERVFTGTRSSSGTGDILQERYASRPFNGGSDHMIFSDPDVGVPCPSLGQWPDKFYHTTADTPDKVDPKMLSAAATLAASYALFAATSGEREAKWLGLEILAKLKKDVTGEVGSRLSSALELRSVAREELAGLRKKLSHMLERSKQGFEHLGRLGLSSDAIMQLKEDANEWVRREFSEAERNFLGMLGRGKVSGRVPESSRVAGRPRLGSTVPDKKLRERMAALVPARVLKGPSGHGLVAETFLRELKMRDKERLWQLTQKPEKVPRALRHFPWYWVDGKRSLAEIAELVELETGMRNDAFLESYFLILEKAGLVKMKRPEG